VTTVLITDGENRSSLAAARSLGRKNHRVLVCSKMLHNISSSSRFCSRRFCVPDPLHDGLGYVEAICDIVTREAVDMIYPMTDHSISLLNRFRSTLPPNAILACVPEEKMRLICDKSHLFRLAARLGVPIPGTLHLNGPEELAEQWDRLPEFPVVIKPALSQIPHGDGFISGGVMYADSPEALHQLYTTRPALRYPSMIQEKINGAGTGLFTLYDKDRHLALFSHRRLREKPPSGGVSVVSESVALDAQMVEDAARLLSAVEWTGVAMVEFKRDERDGTAKLMEINGRLWGTLQLAIACGVDFPCLLMDYLQGKDLSIALGRYQTGHKLKWFLGTLDHLAIRLKNRREALNLTPGSPSKGRALMQFFHIWEKNTSFDVFDCDDPGPFRCEATAYLQQIRSIRK
jgi:predicted ATP-grasp superfamily ATP-dependent carboligase